MVPLKLNEQLMRRNRKFKEREVVNILKTVDVIEDKQSFLYSDFLFVLANRRFSLDFIKIVLAQLYKQTFPKIQIEWRNLLNHENMVNDIETIKKKAVDQQWTIQHSLQKVCSSKQKLIENYHKSIKNRNGIRKRMKQLQDEMKIESGKIDIAKKDEEVLQHQKKFINLQKEYRYWKNQSRKDFTVDISLDNKSVASRSQQKIDQIYSRIQEITKQQTRLDAIKSMCDASPTLDLKQAGKNKSKKSIQGFKKKMKKNQIQKLESLFAYYSKQDTKEAMLFHEMIESREFLSLESFMRFVKDFQAKQKLKIEQIVDIFKIHSKGAKKIKFTQFTNIIGDLCKSNCHKLQIQYTPKILDSFIEKQLLGERYQKMVLNQQTLKVDQSKIYSQLFPNNLREKILSKYSFNVQSHTGKHKQDILNILKQKKKIVQRKELAQKKKIRETIQTFEAKISEVNLKQTRYTGKYQSKQPSRNSNTFTPVKIIDQFKTNNETIYNTNDRSFASGLKYSNIDSYAKRFKNKLSEKVKVKVERRHLTENNSSIQIASSRVHRNTEIQQNCGDSKQLEALVRFGDKDDFLEKHLNINQPARILVHRERFHF